MLGKELERAGGIAVSLGLPSGAALGQDGVDLGRLHLLAGDAHDGQRALGDVDLDEVALLDQGNRAAHGSLGRNVTDSRAL